jgi:hypothetical protein
MVLLFQHFVGEHEEHYRKNSVRVVCYLTMMSISKLHSVHDRMINECGAVGGMRIGRGKRNTQKTLASATLFTTRPT